MSNSVRKQEMLNRHLEIQDHFAVLKVEMKQILRSLEEAMDKQVKLFKETEKLRADVEIYHRRHVQMLDL